MFSLVKDRSCDLAFHNGLGLFFHADLSLNFSLGLALCLPDSRLFSVDLALLSLLIDRHKFGAMIFVLLAQAGFDQEVRIVLNVVVLIHEHIDLAEKPR